MLKQQGDKAQPRHAAATQFAIENAEGLLFMGDSHAKPWQAPTSSSSLTHCEGGGSGLDIREVMLCTKEGLEGMQAWPLLQAPARAHAQISLLRACSNIFSATPNQLMHKPCALVHQPELHMRLCSIVLAWQADMAAGILQASGVSA